MYSFARCDNRLEAWDFDPTYRAASHFGSTAQNYLKHAPWINQLMQRLPDYVASRLHPAMSEFIKQKRVRPGHREVVNQTDHIDAEYPDPGSGHPS